MDIILQQKKEKTQKHNLFSLLPFSYLLHQRRMHKRRRHRHHPLDVHHHPPIMAHTHKHPFHSFEDAAGDTYPGSLGEVQLGGFKIEHSLVVGARHGDEAAHLRVRDDDGLAGFAVHDIADGDVHARLVLYFVHTLTGGADEDQVMDRRNKLAQAALFPHDILIAHGNIVFNALCIQVFLEKKLSAIGDTHCIPVHFCILVHKKI